MKFIAELIVCKILKKMIIKYCIAKLFSAFLTHYNLFKENNTDQDSIYDFYSEAIIEFIENVGEKYEAIDEKEKEGKKESALELIKDHA